MVATYRASMFAEPSLGGGTATSVTVPGTVQAGDLLVLAYVGPNPAPPSGWSPLLSTTIASTPALVWTRTATSGDAGSTITVTMANTTSSNVGLQLGLVAFASPATTGAVSASAVGSQASGTALTTSAAAPVLPAGRYLPLYLLLGVQNTDSGPHTDPTVTTTATTLLGYKGKFNGIGAALDATTGGGSNSAQTFGYTPGGPGEGWDFSRVLAVGISTEQTPFAPTALAPDGNVSIDSASIRRFSWTFTDPDAGDVQSAYDLRYRIVGATTWTTVSGSTPNRFRDFPAGTFSSADYEWQVRSYDSLDFVSPWSASAFFHAAPAPDGPVFTSPVNGATIPTSSVTATISAPSLTDLQWQVLGDDAGAPDPGNVINAGSTIHDPTARSFTASGLPNSTTVHLQVRVQNDGLWSPWADSTNPVSYTPPAVPALVVTAQPDTASIAVQVANPAPSGSQPAVSSWDLYRRTDSGDGIRVATNLVGDWRDYSPGSGTDYTYRARVFGDNGTDTYSAWTG